MDLDALLASLPTVDVSPDLVVCDASTESMLTILPSVDLTTEDHRITISLGLASACDKTVNLRR